MLWSTIKKDSQLLIHDRGTLLSLFLLPLIFVAVFGSLFGNEATEARLLAISYPQSNPTATELVARIESSGLYKLRSFDDAVALRAWVASDTARFGLIVPPDFAAGRAAQLIIDPSAPLSFRGPIEGSLRALVQFVPPSPDLPRTHLELQSPPGVRSAYVIPSGFQLSVPGNAVLFGFFLALTMALSFSEEKRTGTWRRLLAAPISRSRLLLAKLVPYYLVGLVQMSFLFGVSALFFDMRVAGSLAALVVLTMLVVLAAVALGLLMASVGGSEKQIGSVGSISLLVMGLLGGAMVPRVVMPPTMQTIGLATPHAWALDGFYDLLMRPGSGFPEVWPAMLALVGFALLFFVVGVLRFRFER